MKHIQPPVSLFVEPACCVLFDADNGYIGSIPINMQEAGQELVTAINAYDAQLAVCVRLVQASDAPNDEDFWLWHEEAVGMARAAMADMKGEDQ